MQDNQPVLGKYVSEDEEIDISKIIIAIWKNKVILLLSILLFLLLSILYLHRTTYEYTAEIKIYPVQSSGGGGVGKQLGGLASLAGVNLPSDKQGSSFELYSEEIYSREIADMLSSDTTLMTIIYRNEWDAKKSQWKKPESPLSSLIAAVKTALGVPVLKWQAPNGVRLQEYIKANVGLEEKLKKSTVTINFRHPDPLFAVQFLNTLYKSTDDRLRQRASERSTKYISYLNKKLESVTVAEYRAALVAILSDQEKLNMIASSDVPYAAESLGSAVASLKPTKPQPRLVLMAGIFVGFMVGILIILARHYIIGDDRRPA